MTSEHGEPSGASDELGGALGDRLQSRAARASIPADGRALISARVDQRRRQAKVRRIGAGGAAVALVAVVVLAASLSRGEDAQQLITNAPVGSTSAASVSSTTTTDGSVEGPGPGRTIGDPTTTIIATLPPSTTTTPPPTAAPPSDVLDWGAPGLPWVVIEDGRVLGGRTGPLLRFAGASSGWISDDWQVSVIQRFTDALLAPVPLDPSWQPVGDGNYLKVTPEAGGWSVLPFTDSGGGGYTSTAADGGFHVSGTDAAMAFDLVAEVLRDEADIPATLEAGDRTLSLVAVAPSIGTPGQGEGNGVTYAGPGEDSNIDISVSPAGQYGWRGEVVPALAYGGVTNVSSVTIGGRDAWVADLARDDGTAASVIAWQPNGESVVVITAYGLDAASLKAIVQSRLHRVSEAIWRQLTASVS